MNKLELKEQDVQAIALQVQDHWNEQAWDQLPKDTRRWDHEIEKEFYENCCFEMGLSESDTQKVLDALGY